MQWFPDGSGCVKCVPVEGWQKWGTKRWQIEKGELIAKKRKPKKEKPKGAPMVSSFGAPPKPAGKRK